MRGFSFPKIRAGLRAGYQLWGSSSEKADIHRKNNYCVLVFVNFLKMPNFSFYLAKLMAIPDFFQENLRIFKRFFFFNFEFEVLRVELYSFQAYTKPKF
jgi:hypothetical protein